MLIFLNKLSILGYAFKKIFVFLNIYEYYNNIFKKGGGFFEKQRLCVVAVV